MLHPQILQRKLLQIATKLRNLRKFSPWKVSRYTVIALQGIATSSVSPVSTGPLFSACLASPISAIAQRTLMKGSQAHRAHSGALRHD